MELNPDFWRRCSSCKTPIKYSASYYVCSVSTCNRKRIGYVFDSVHCWERHLPGARHKDAAAVEAKAPTFEQWKAELGDDAVAPRAAGVAVAGSGPGATSGVASSPTTSQANSNLVSSTKNGGASALSATGARAPLTPEQQAAAVAAARSPQRVIARPAAVAPSGGAKPAHKDALESEILVVVSKLKNYVKERADMNTSDSVANVLSDKIRRLCDRAIDNARADGRKTVMDRDFT